VALQKTSIYDVEAIIHDIEGGEASKTIMVKGRKTDWEGYTSSDWSRAEEGFILSRGPGWGLRFAWNRDTGEVGVHDVTDVDDLVTVFTLKQLRCNERGDCTVVSSELPRGAFDQETPPEWPPVRKRPPFKPNFPVWKP